ncbi:MAG: Uma2 family endonuclease [Verrucomicrobia bacterium]|nr:Uma2 family endonuclease [Verrucomicrobiota bacterium]
MVTDCLSIQDYHRLVEAGTLAEDARVELLEGRIVPMSPIGPRHRWTVSKLLQAFTQQQRGRYETLQDAPLPIPEHDEPQPDLMLCRPGTATPWEHPKPADVFLVVEVADATLNRDLGSKAKLYEGAGIAEYWVVDLDKSRLHVFTREDDRYRKQTVEEGSASPKAFPDVTIDLDALGL